MNITMLVLNNFTNDARVHKEASTLARVGHNVTVLALWQSGIVENENQNGYRVIRLRLRSRPWQNRLLSPPIKYLEFALQVWRLAGRQPAQIYHANDANTLPAAWIAVKRNHAKLVYDAHELETGRDFGGGYVTGLYRYIWSWPERLFIRRAHIVLTVSPSIRNQLSRLYNIPLPQVILNCPEKIQIPYSNRLREELNITETHKILLYQGRVTVGRGIESFCTAVQLVENVSGVVLGDGTALDTFRDRVRSGEWQRLHFPGKVPLADLPSYTSSSDLGIVLTQDTCLNHRFSIPNKLFEYMHAGIPIIASDLPEIGRIISETETGEVCDSNDPHAIATAIQMVLSDSTYYNQLQKNACKAADNYNWQKEGKKLLDEYAKL